MKKESAILLLGIVLSTNTVGKTLIIQKKRMSFSECSQYHLDNVASFGGALQTQFLVLRMDAMVVRYCTNEKDGSTVLFSCMHGFMEIKRSAERGSCP
ncbi:MAG: hypothetical protein GY703_02695 [Gammaproteobacteria bacterium]|nr:hypothetical protein [Gammaproteobacteria bacterium]